MRLSPSFAARRMACPGSHKLEAPYEADSSEFAKEGSAAHWLAMKFLVEIDYSEIVRVGDNTPYEGVLVDQEMIDAALVYARHYYSIYERYYLKISYIEQKLNISNINENCSGTCDAWLFSNDELFVWDFKYGHKYVDAFENWQLIEYVAGILQFLKESKIHYENNINVNMFIVQPRNFHKDGFIRHWKISLNKLEEYFSRLRISESLAVEEGAACVPSSECLYCNARAVCSALQQATYNRIDYIFENSSNELTPQQLAKELELLEESEELIKSRLTGLKQQALSIIREGGTVPGYRAEASVGREVWKCDNQTILLLGQTFGIDLRKPQEFITPKQAISKKIPADVIRGYTEQRKGELKLERDRKASRLLGGVVI